MLKPADIKKCSNSIFVSYSRNDRKRLLWLTDNLSAAKFTPFVDTQMPTSVRWENFLQKKISECACLLVVWSRCSIESHEVRKEVAYALQNDKPVIPVRIDNVLPPEDFRHLNTADLSAWSGYSGFSEWKKVIDSLEAFGVPHKVCLNPVHMLRKKMRDHTAIGQNQQDQLVVQDKIREVPIKVGSMKDFNDEITSLARSGYEIVAHSEGDVCLEKKNILKMKFFIPLVMFFIIPGVVYYKVIKNSPHTERVRVILVEEHFP